MQLVAYGAQDIYLTGNPQITFFKVVYRRHTNFSMEAVKQTFNGTEDFGGSVSATISRNGDLLYRMYLEHDVRVTAASADSENAIMANYGSRLMKECELEIGGQKIDKHYGHWHSVYSQLTELNPTGNVGGGVADSFPDTKNSNSTLFNYMSGNGKGFRTKTNSARVNVSNGWTSTSLETSANGHLGGRFFIPLYFWFCRNPGLALPLIALQYHEVKVKMTFEDKNKLFGEDAVADLGSGAITAGTGNATGSDGTGSPTFDLWCDYIYLDTDERRRFAQVSHEYLIEQLQYSSFSGETTMDINFNHPVKELIWSGQPTTNGQASGTLGADLDEGTEAYSESLLSAGTWQLKLNGHDRFKERDFKYFTRTQIWEHHTGYGGSVIKDSIGVYSFALKPEEHQPSGTCNFSRIDNAQLVQTASDKINLYAVNYNVLRIMSGMGGLAYSN